jgi:DMSO/TMAO reductase YedYZ heme-binding membrane subunit
LALAFAGGRVTSWSTIAWDTARAGGFLAYILLTFAVAAGLVLRNRWQSARWPRLVTNELHGYLSLLALVFIAVHVLAVLVDPFTRFGLAEVLVPFASHYRPVWMSLGIVALYLLLAVWLSSQLRARIGHRTWRSIHVLAYGVYGTATVHGLGTGSDTRTVWAPILYASSVVLVCALAGRRLLVPPARGDRARPGLAVAGGLAVVAMVAWTGVGPLAAHWGARAGGVVDHRAAAAALPSGTRTAPTPRSGDVALPFRAKFNGHVAVQPVDQSGRVTVRIDGALRGGTRDHLEIYLRGIPLENGGVEMEQSRVRMGAETALYQGQIVALRGTQLVAALHSDKRQLRLGITLNLSGDGLANGSVRGTRITGGSA